MKFFPYLNVLFLSLGLSMSTQAKDGRWIDPADPAIPIDFKYQGEYLGALEGGGKMSCQVVSLGAGVFQAVLYPGGLPGAGWDGKNRSSGDNTHENWPYCRNEVLACQEYNRTQAEKSKSNQNALSAKPFK